MTNDAESEHKNFIEAKLIIQEFHDDTNVFVVGTAPFGRVWFDRERVEQQYNVLSDSWYQEYGDSETKHSKKPRVINILIDEADPMFNRYRDANRESQTNQASSEVVADAPNKEEYPNNSDNVKSKSNSKSNSKSKSKRKSTDIDNGTGMTAPEKMDAESAKTDTSVPAAEKKKEVRGKKKKEVNEVVSSKSSMSVDQYNLHGEVASSVNPMARKKKKLVVEDEVSP